MKRLKMVIILGLVFTSVTSAEDNPRFVPEEPSSGGMNVTTTTVALDVDDHKVGINAVDGTEWKKMQADKKSEGNLTALLAGIKKDKKPTEHKPAPTSKPTKKDHDAVVTESTTSPKKKEVETNVKLNPEFSKASKKGKSTKGSKSHDASVTEGVVDPKHRKVETKVKLNPEFSSKSHDANVTEGVVDPNHRKVETKVKLNLEFSSKAHDAKVTETVVAPKREKTKVKLKPEFSKGSKDSKKAPSTKVKTRVKIKPVFAKKKPAVKKQEKKPAQKKARLRRGPLWSGINSKTRIRHVTQTDGRVTLEIEGGDLHEYESGAHHPTKANDLVE